MAIIRDDNSRRRYRRSFVFSLRAGLIISFIISILFVALGITNFFEANVEVWLGILVLIIGVLNFINITSLFAFNGFYFILLPFKFENMVWKKKWLWTIITACLLNFVLIPFLIYSNVNRMIYNELVNK